MKPGDKVVATMSYLELEAGKEYEVFDVSPDTRGYTDDLLLLHGLEEGYFAFRFRKVGE